MHFPNATWAEKEGTFTNGDGLVQKIRVALKPRGGILPDIEIFRRLGLALGLQLGLDTAAAAFAALSQAVNGYQGIAYRELQNGYGHLRTGTEPGSNATAAAAGR